MRWKSLSSASIAKCLRRTVLTDAIQKLSQCQQKWRQAVRGEHVTQPIANLYTYRTAVEAIDLNAM
jgi:hypothetical protein